MNYTWIFETLGFHSIRSIGYYPSIVQNLESNGIPIEIIDQLYFFKINPQNLALYSNHYDLIHQENPYRPIPFSYDDFMLAYLAAENGYSVVSYDHHLLDSIHAYLDYPAYHPGDLDLIPGDEILFLDSNILLKFFDGTEDLDEVMSIFQINPNLTFLLSNHIYLEMKSKIHEWNTEIQNSKAQNDQSIPEQRLAHYIDDFSHFTSYNRKRKAQKKKKQNKTSNMEKYSTVSRKYRHLVE